MYGKIADVMFTPERVSTLLTDKIPDSKIHTNIRILALPVKDGEELEILFGRLYNHKKFIEEFPDPRIRARHIATYNLFGCQLKDMKAGDFETLSRAAAFASERIFLKFKVKFTNITETEDELRKLYKEVIGTEMKFDVTIGNPPYNKGMDIDFINKAYEMSSDLTIMIVPAKWQTADASQKMSSQMGYGEFRNKLVPHMSHVVFYPDSADVFNARLDSGITYFLMDKEVHNECLVDNRCKLQKALNSRDTRSIINGESLFNIGNELNELLKGYPKFNKFNTGKGKYAVSSSLMFSGGGGRVSHGVLSDGGGNGGNTFSLSGNLLVTTPSKVSETNQVKSGQSILWQSDNIDECESFKSWLDTKFVRFMLFIGLGNRNLDNLYSFRFVPVPPFGKFDHLYIDKELYKHYGLARKYIDVIEAVIRER